MPRGFHTAFTIHHSDRGIHYACADYRASSRPLPSSSSSTRTGTTCTTSSALLASTSRDSTIRKGAIPIMAISVPLISSGSHASSECSVIPVSTDLGQAQIIGRRTRSTYYLSRDVTGQRRACSLAWLSAGHHTGGIDALSDCSHAYTPRDVRSTWPSCLHRTMYDEPARSIVSPPPQRRQRRVVWPSRARSSAANSALSTSTRTSGVGSVSIQDWLGAQPSSIADVSTSSGAFHFATARCARNASGKATW